MAPLRDIKSPIRVAHHLTKSHRIVPKQGVELTYEEKIGDRRKEKRLLLPVKDKDLCEMLEETYVKVCFTESILLCFVCVVKLIKAFML